MEKVEIYNGNIGLILQYGSRLFGREKIEYYQSVIYEIYIERGALDWDKDMGDNTVRNILNKEIESEKIKLASVDLVQVVLGQEVDELTAQNKMLNNELSNANQKLKRLNKIKHAKLDYSRFLYTEVIRIADATRKKNQKLNYRQIAVKLGVDDKTAKNICIYHNIK